MKTGFVLSSFSNTYFNQILVAYSGESDHRFWSPESPYA